MEENNNKEFQQLNQKSQLLMTIKQNCDKLKLQYVKKYKHTDELLRINFKSENQSECIKTLNKILNGIEFQVAGYEVFGKNYNVSSLYPAFKLIINNEEYFIVNIYKSFSLVKPKLLCPKNVLKNIKYDFGTFEQLASNVKFTQINNRELPTSVAKFLKLLIQIVAESNVSEHVSISNLIIDILPKTNYEITIDIPENLFETYSKLFNTLSKSNNIINISNDFGEVLQPLILFKHIQNINSVKFPSETNQPLIDFYINDLLFSAKSKAGRSPSTKVIINNIKKYPENLTKEEQAIFDHIKSLFSSSVFISTKNIILEFLKSSNQYSDILNILNKKCHFETSKNVKEFAANIYKNENIVELFDNIYELYRKHNLTELENDIKTTNHTDASLVGNLLYPLMNSTIAYLNYRYSETLTNIIKKFLSYYQSYLKILKTKLVLVIKYSKSNQTQFKFKNSNMTRNTFTSSYIPLCLVTVKD